MFLLNEYESFLLALTVSIRKCRCVKFRLGMTGAAPLTTFTSRTRQKDALLAGDCWGAPDLLVLNVRFPLPGLDQNPLTGCWMAIPPVSPSHIQWIGLREDLQETLSI